MRDLDLAGKIIAKGGASAKVEDGFKAMQVGAIMAQIFSKDANGVARFGGSADRRGDWGASFPVRTLQR
ncbi:MULTISPECIES: hypothetical protein [unclassified Mesorhizobium]|uniref:hypothetical protein n=1 Tax=unclassified Mesorhizobium TaxID=325217 RepID=UPI00163D979D|nr:MULTISPECIES: hypothetical protein [unclassified Mesorhizobium]